MHGPDKPDEMVLKGPVTEIKMCAHCNFIFTLFVCFCAPCDTPPLSQLCMYGSHHHHFYLCDVLRRYHHLDLLYFRFDFLNVILSLVVGCFKREADALR